MGPVLEKSTGGQDIEYTINFAQSLKVNSEANETFNIYLGRDVDQLVSSVQNVLDLEAKQKNWIIQKDWLHTPLLRLLIQRFGWMPWRSSTSRSCPSGIACTVTPLPDSVVAINIEL